MMSGHEPCEGPEEEEKGGMGGCWREAGEEGTAWTALPSGAQLSQACCLGGLPVVPSALLDTKRGTGVPLPGMFAPRHVLPAAEGGSSWSSQWPPPPGPPVQSGPQPCPVKHALCCLHSTELFLIVAYLLACCFGRCFPPLLTAKDLDRLFTAPSPGPAA